MFTFVILLINALTLLVGALLFGGNIFIATIGAIAILLLLVVAYDLYKEDSLERGAYKRRMNAYKELTDSIGRL